jgi:GNAT superfamily N-acetyltransferase
MEDIKIRKAVENDLSSILLLYNPDIDNGDTLDLPSAKNVFNRIMKYPNYNVYVAMIDQDIVGTFELLIMDNLAHHGAKSGLVEDIIVSSHLRDQGIGKQMMKFAMEECKKAGCYKLTLSSNRKRQFAHKFYEGLGFQKHGYSFQIDL